MKHGFTHKGSYQFWARVLVVVSLLGISISARPVRTVSGQAGTLQPEVRYAGRVDLSVPLLTQVQPEQAASAGEWVDESLDNWHSERRTFPKTTSEAGPQVTVAAIATSDVTLQLPTPEMPTTMPATDFNFEGVGNRNSVLPPDTNGDVGPNHYVQWVNLSLQIWSLNRATKTATSVYGPVNGNTLWSGFGGHCEWTNDGDPIVLYDHLADRWLISQFALPYEPSGPFYECVAVSQSGDPTGAWYRYEFQISETKMNDYPKLGVWPDGYYMTVNQFEDDFWAGAAAVVFEREKMLAGLPARMVYFDLAQVNYDYGGMLPSDLDGPAPAAGTPNTFVEVDDAGWIPPADAMRIWEFRVNWTNPSLSTFGNNGYPNQTLGVAEFNVLCISTRSCIPQPNTSNRIDAIADRLMHRLQYRSFNGYATLVTNHTVDVGSGRAGVRWYEVRRSGSAWAIYQQGTYAGADASEHRWMGSAAMDSAGNLAIGYSVSGPATYPGIRYTGRLGSDPLGTLPQGEQTLRAGNGSQLNYQRWGDYSMLSVDPLDGCTFWYTNQYYSLTSSVAWRTRIGSFTFPNCTAGAKGNLQGFVFKSGTTQPIEGARVQAGEHTTYSAADGSYLLLGLAPGAYSVTASAYGYNAQTIGGIPINPNQTTYQNFGLQPAPMVTVSGVVKDGSGQGWPMYARLEISASGFAQSVFTHPQSGYYTVSLAQGVLHTVQVTSSLPGYISQETTVTPAAGGTTLNLSLAADLAVCAAPGYANPGSGCTPQAGGLLTGFVADENTAAGLNGAQVTRSLNPAETTQALATPDDPAQPDGLYFLFSSQTGEVAFEAGMAHYVQAAGQVVIQSAQVAKLDFKLKAGLLAAEPEQVVIKLPLSGLAETTIRLDNLGGASASYTISEVAGGLVAPASYGMFAQPERHVSPKQLDALDARGVYDYTPPEVNILPGGGLLASWPTNLARPWGIGLNPLTGVVWVGDAASGGGDGELHRFRPDGQPLPGRIPGTLSGAAFSADLAYDPFRQVFWQVNVGGDNCLEALDPAGLQRTGQRICPALGVSGRGLAFNPLDGSFFTGSWADGQVVHFSAEGIILDSFDLEINIAGLAFNPDSGHLFVLSNADRGQDIYVVDPQAAYRLVDGFNIAELTDFGAAGLELDCTGHLWLVDQQTGYVLQVESGETSACAWNDIPWLVVSPTSGALGPGASQDLLLSIDAGQVPLGVNTVKLVVSNDTPYGPLDIWLMIQKGEVLFLPLAPR